LVSSTSCHRSVLTGTATGRANDAEVTVFDSVGFALEDYSSLRLLRDLAQELGLGAPVGLIPKLTDPKDLFGHLLAEAPLPLRRVA